MADPELISTLEMMAESGDFESQKTLSYIYFSGQGVDVDNTKSLYWSEIAMKNSECDDEERFEIRILIARTYLGEKKYNEALELFAMLLEIKQLDLLYIYIADIHFYMEDGQATELYEKLLNKEPALNAENKLHANRRLGDIHLLKKDYAVSLKYYDKVANELICNKNKGKLDLNDIYTKKIYGHDLNNIAYANEMCGNFVLAQKYYEMASEVDCDFASLNLGLMYDNGVIGHDMEKALMYYAKGQDSYERWKIAREK